MDIELLVAFFKWCTLFNGSLLLFWAAMCVFIPDTVYRLQSKWFPMSRDHYNLAMYAFLGLFKIVFLVFNVVPLLSLLMLS
jgi:hypothetical protein